MHIKKIYDAKLQEIQIQLSLRSLIQQHREKRHTEHHMKKFSRVVIEKVKACNDY